MYEMKLRQSIAQLEQALVENGYSANRVQHFSNTTNQLLKFMDSYGIREYSMDVGVRFMREQYGFHEEEGLSKNNRSRMQDLTMLSEMQLHGTFVLRHRNRKYRIPPAFGKAVNEFLAHRRFCGIVERNMGTIELYLERFFTYLLSQSVECIEQITGEHMRDYLRYISGFSNMSKDHMMRTVRQFMEYCWQQHYHSQNLCRFAPNVHYDKRAKIPSAYSKNDVLKILSMIDRSNPVGKRNYAILLLVTRLGLRTGDVSSLRFENIDWEHNRITLTQHKTGRPLTLSLLEDVGLAIIDYLKHGRPNSDSNAVFLSHKPPYKDCNPSSLYRIVSDYIRKAGLTIHEKKRGPHALRHSLASRLLEEKIPLPVISEILGHASTDTTAIYLSISIDQLRRCALEV